ncbi:hypothetical protein DFH27DRAFT_560745 [Peziza echinospora]|nr:hypothetical protein DFH27DRAFT_560745 [Peziza echinospora]
MTVLAALFAIIYALSESLRFSGQCHCQPEPEPDGVCLADSIFLSQIANEATRAVEKILPGSIGNLIVDQDTEMSCMSVKIVEVVETVKQFNVSIREIESKLNDRMDKLEARMDKLEKKFDQLDEKMEVSNESTENTFSKGDVNIGFSSEMLKSVLIPHAIAGDFFPHGHPL